VPARFKSRGGSPPQAWGRRLVDAGGEGDDRFRDPDDAAAVVKHADDNGSHFDHMSHAEMTAAAERLNDLDKPELEELAGGMRVFFPRSESAKATRGKIKYRLFAIRNDAIKVPGISPENAGRKVKPD
jgi:hypothetical protein